jgi:hypothetical protein
VLDPLGSSPKLAEVGDRLLHEQGECCGEGCTVCKARLDPTSKVPAPWNKGKKLRPISQKARGDFLAGLADGLTVRLAAEKAGRAHPRRFYDLRAEDETFAEEWAEAHEQGTQVLEDELRKRATEGWEERLSEFKDGELVRETVTRRYSPALLIFLLKSRRPDVYRDNVQVTAGGQVTFVLDSLLDRARRQIADVEIAGELEAPEDES